MTRNNPLSTPALLAAALLSALLPALASAQAAYPSKPLRLIAPQPPGGGPERVLRGMANGLQQRLGQTVLVDYKPGASGNLAAAETVRAGADGHTLMLGPETALTLNPLVYPNLGYNKADLQPLSLIGSFTQVLICHPSVGAKTLADLVARAKTTPLSYASGGQGSPGHLTMEMWLAAAGAPMTHVPYKGPQPAVQDLIGGQVHCGFLVGAIAGEHIKSGRLVALATSGSKRSAGLPQVPTVAESGYPGFNATFWLTVFVPRGLDAGVQQKLLTAVNESVQSTEVREAMLANDTVPEGSTPEQAQKVVETIAQSWASVAKRVSLKVE